MPLKLSKLFCSKDKNFAALLFFLAACNKNSSGQMRQVSRQVCDRYHVGWRWSTWWLVEDRMSTGLTNTHTAHGFSDLYHVFARKQCILCYASHHGCLNSMLHRFKIFSAPGTIVHGSIRLPPCSLASSGGCSLAKKETKIWTCL